MEGYKFYQKWKGKLSKDNLMIIILIGLLLVVISLPSKDRKQENYSISETTASTESGTTSLLWNNGLLSDSNYENSDANPNSLEYGIYLETSLEELLRKMEGVGEVQVMITFLDLGEKTILPKVEGIVIVAEGAGIGKISGELVKVVQTLFDLEAHKIKVVKMNK